MTTKVLILERLRARPMSVRELSLECGICRATVYHSINLLEAKGLIQEHSTRRVPPSRKHETVFAVRSTQ
jgi:DNA-binding IclR family transcriptional regulator